MSLRLVILVLDNPELVREVLDAWNEAGAPGATVVHSIGMGRIERGLRDDVPLFPSLKDMLEQDELHHRTLFTVVEGDDIINKIVEATETIVGDLNRPNTGILFTVPVDFARGVRRRQQ
ncbi:MAG: hypothetical protein KatS3mg057_1167 [Herpetosiphonaceae bacterium]|nr:MAG: hypothetical protein KatS3mg057_1167 [Herpetosiphonaceae bacterium]